MHRRKETKSSLRMAHFGDEGVMRCYSDVLQVELLKEGKKTSNNSENYTSQVATNQPWLIPDGICAAASELLAHSGFEARHRLLGCAAGGFSMAG